MDTTTKMKLFIFDEILCSYGNGIAFAVAETHEEALEKCMEVFLENEERILQETYKNIQKNYPLLTQSQKDLKMEWERESSSERVRDFQKDLFMSTYKEVDIAAKNAAGYLRGSE